MLRSIDYDSKLMQGCKLRGIKLCGALAAAGLIAAHSSKNLPHHHKEKYAVVTLTDCRSILEPPLSNQHLGKQQLTSFNFFFLMIKRHIKVIIKS